MKTEKNKGRNKKNRTKLNENKRKQMRVKSSKMAASSHGKENGGQWKLKQDDDLHLKTRVKKLVGLFCFL